MTRKAEAATATCPCCERPEKPLVNGRFTKHSDTVTGDCPAVGHTPEEARKLAPKGGESHDESARQRGAIQAAPGGPPSQVEERVAASLSTGTTWTGIATADTSRPEGASMREEVTMPGATTDIRPKVPTDGASNNTTPATEVDTATSGPRSQRTRKPRSDRAQYLVLPNLPGPLAFGNLEAAVDEAIDRAEKEPENAAWVVWQGRVMLRYEKGVKVTRLGRVRKGKA